MPTLDARITERQRTVRAVLRAHSGPFNWGDSDCVSLARDVWHALGGRALDLPAWRSEQEAAAIIAQHGTLQAAMCAALGAPAAAPPEDGDVAVVSMPGGTQIAAVYAAGRPLARAARGVVPLPPSWALAHWRPA